jgi:glycosyltransferase involved in cell wall biosynthesis
MNTNASKQVLTTEIDSSSDYLTGSRICFFIPSFGNGGVERMMTNLMNSLVQSRNTIDLIVSENFEESPFNLSPRVNIIKHSSSGKAAINDLIHYLNSKKPSILLSVKESADFTALNAKQKSNIDTKFIVRLPTAMMERFQRRKTSWVRMCIKKFKLHNMYKHADGFIAVAEGTKADFKRLLPSLKQDMVTLKNPVITPQLLKQQNEIVKHRWAQSFDLPLVIGIGGFRKQKDFSTLIRAFALVNQSRPCRLVILGQGRQEDRLKKLCSDLGIAEHVDFPGFSDNPYAWLKRADLFVLSSLWEGSPNVLTEALAIGTPVVSTDCQSGPREVLQDGKYGELVPLQDPEAMAEAMMRTLDKPIAPETLQQAVKDYTVEASTQAYLDAFRFFLSQKGKI